MQVHVVRSAHAGCEPQCLQWIAAQGKIVAGTLGRFKKVLRRLRGRTLPIFIDSSGGSVNEALAIGRLIRAEGLYLAVTRTVFTPCAPANATCRKAKTGGELRGLAQARLSKCVSSCAFLLAGGARRFVGPGTVVGVHQISMTLRKYKVMTRRSFGAPVRTRKTLVAERKVGQKHAQVRSTYSSIRRYFAEMGIREDIMPLIMSAPNDAMRWLTRRELLATRLATHSISGEQLITGAATSTPAPAAAPEMLGYQDLCQRLGDWKAGCEREAWPSDSKHIVPPGLLPPLQTAPAK